MVICPRAAAPRSSSAMRWKIARGPTRNVPHFGYASAFPGHQAEQSHSLRPRQHLQIVLVEVPQAVLEASSDRVALDQIGEFLGRFDHQGGEQLSLLSNRE